MERASEGPPGSSDSEGIYGMSSSCGLLGVQVEGYAFCGGDSFGLLLEIGRALGLVKTQVFHRGSGVGSVVLLLGVSDFIKVPRGRFYAMDRVRSFRTCKGPVEIGDLRFYRSADWSICELEDWLEEESFEPGFFGPS
jgi:hypothetical protein